MVFKPTAFTKQKNLKCLLIVLLVLVLIIVVVLCFVLSPGSEADVLNNSETNWIYPDPMVATGAVVSNGGPCAAIGQKILKKYGNAVDSIIATMLCDGLTCPYAMGLGGGFMATLYLKNESKAITLIARETAPAAATFDMFSQNFNLSKSGGLAVAVPGELKGYWEMYKKYGGKAPWKELFADAIKMCEEGIPVNKRLADEIKNRKEVIMRRPALRMILENNRGELAGLGDTIKNLKLAKTLRIIAEEGMDALYNGSLTAGFVKDIQDNGGIITEQDMNSYNVRWDKPINVQLSSGINLYSVGPPASGQLLGFMLSVLNDTMKPDMDIITNVSMITETFKYAYALRSHFADPYFVNITKVLQKINDPVFINKIKQRIITNQTNNDPKYYGADYYDKEDMGTGNIAVIAPNGDAVSATSTINTIFGSRVVSVSTGIILNNQMDDFSTPGSVNTFGVYPSEENFIQPGKRPLSSVCPSILVDKNGDVILVIGGAGGTRITTATALTIIRNIWQHLPIAKAVDLPRFHHQLMPMEWYYETEMPMNIVSGMKARGHESFSTPTSSVVTAITKTGELFSASSDRRRPGNTSYLLLPCDCKS